MRIDAPCDNHTPALRALWKEAFGDTEEFLDIFWTTAFSSKRCRCVIIDEKVAASLYWFDCYVKDKPVAYIYAVATAKAFRGKGICHKLMENTHQHLKCNGYEGALLVPGSNELFRFYESVGYQTCSRIRECSCLAKTAEISLKSIEKEEYAGLRREFLPEGGVVQENENLKFLDAQANFYKGEDFLLAACKRGSILRGLELLGNESRAAEIVYALGYEEGIFRMPGAEKPFAMYYPLNRHKTMPAYFGLAFD